MNLQHEVATAVEALGAFAAGLDVSEAPDAVRASLALTVTDTLAVGCAGGLTAELAQLRDAWTLPAGPAGLWGAGPGSVGLGSAGRRTDVATATLLNGIAVCSLELDEGNKFARGHPAAHVVPVAIAVAEQLRVSGPRLLSAILAGYEVATRFARAGTPRPGLHPHGNWGAIGAATAVGVLYGLDATRLAAAIDAAGGLVLATGFESALAGSFVRNTWVGCAGTAGLIAANLARADLGTVDGTAASTLGDLLGTIDPAALTEDLGDRFDITGGYFKRHSSCSYTHPPADAAIELRTANPGLAVEEIDEVVVFTHRLAAPLSRTRPPTRLAAMFSIPYVVAVALREGECPPSSFDSQARTDPVLDRLAARVRVEHLPDFDRRLPAERVARVRVRLRDGRELTAEVPNPVGDANYHPFGRAEIGAKLARLLQPAFAAQLVAVAEELWSAPDAAAVLARLIDDGPGLTGAPYAGTPHVASEGAS